MNEAEARLLAKAAAHYGIVTRAQALRAGLTERQVDYRVATGRWEIVHPAVYRIAGTPITGRQRAYAACLSVDAIVSHTTGGALLRLQGVRARGVEVSLEYGRNGHHPKGVKVHRTTDLPRTDRVVVDDIPCTNGTRTIIDLASVLDDEALETAFESARRMGLTSPTALARRFETLGGKGRPGSARIKHVLDVAGERPKDSKLEVKTARLLRRHGLLPRVQHRVGEYRLDFAWLDVMFAVECDGFDWHGYRLAWSATAGASRQSRRRVGTLCTSPGTTSPTDQTRPCSESRPH